MAAPITWTKEQDEAIMALVPGDKLTFAGLAQRWGIARWTVRERAKRLGIDVAAFLVPPQNRTATDSLGNPVIPLEPDRAPYPPGHHVTWDTIVEGTCLAGVEYPR